MKESVVLASFKTLNDEVQLIHQVDTECVRPVEVENFAYEVWFSIYGNWEKIRDLTLASAQLQFVSVITKLMAQNNQ